MQVRDLFRGPRAGHGPARVMAIGGAFVLLNLLVLTGCTAGAGLAKPAGTASEFQRDHAACVSWMHGVSAPRGRGPLRWTYYDWCMHEKGYRKEGVVASEGQSCAGRP